MSKRFYETTKHSDLYAQCRPTYPVDVIKKILDYLSCKYRIQDDDVAIDIGCGTGQSTVLLAPYFKQIIGYDISENQIKKANETNQHSNIVYKNLLDNHDIPHEDSSLALIISGQAAHWLNLTQLYNEAKRTLKTNGVLALFGYAFVQIHGPQSDKLNRILMNFYTNTLHGYVQKESIEVYFNRYRDKKYYIPLSSSDFIRDESVKIYCTWSIRQLLGYILSSSGPQHFLQQHPESTVFDDLRNEIFECLQTSNDEHELDLSFDLFILMNRKTE